MKCPVNGIFKLGQGREKHIMGIFPARNSPYLFYRVEVRRVRRQLDKGYACKNIGIFRGVFLPNQAHGLLVPWCIVHDKGILLPLRGRMGFQKAADG